jgi:serine protease AprX
VIAGIVTMLFQVDPDATSAQVVSAITSTAYRYHDGAPYRAGSSFDKGAGLVDAYAAALRMGAHRV